MFSFNRHIFVLQRRINRSPDAVLLTIANPALFGAGSVLSSDAAGALRLCEPFRRVDMYPGPTWRAPAALVTARGRTIAAVEIELGAWSAIDSELLLRPSARRPERWSGFRVRRYFAHAHRAADDVTHLLMYSVPTAKTAERAV